jgi:hypothetical protein
MGSRVVDTVIHQDRFEHQPNANTVISNVKLDAIEFEESIFAPFYSMSGNSRGSARAARGRQRVLDVILDRTPMHMVFVRPATPEAVRRILAS